MFTDIFYRFANTSDDDRTCIGAVTPAVLGHAVAWGASADILEGCGPESAR